MNTATRAAVSAASIFVATCAQAQSSLATASNVLPGRPHVVRSPGVDLDLYNAPRPIDDVAPPIAGGAALLMGGLGLAARRRR